MVRSLSARVRPTTVIALTNGFVILTPLLAWKQHAYFDNPCGAPPLHSFIKHIIRLSGEPFIGSPVDAPETRPQAYARPRATSYPRDWNAAQFPTEEAQAGPVARRFR